MEYDYIQILEQLRTVQKPTRFMHTLGVAYTSANLAMRYGVDVQRAYLAGLLHDCAKHMSQDQLLDFCLEHHIAVSDAQNAMPFLLHGKVGAFIANERFDIKDELILASIEWHTTGRPDMTMLEKIVFVSDYIEPHRDKAPNLTMLRELSYENIDKAVYLIAKQTLDYLDNQVIDEATLETYNFYKKYVDF